MLRAGHVEPPENFDWRLRLRLNRMLAEAARDATAPWGPNESRRSIWLRRFGISAALSLAAVVAVALFADEQPSNHSFAPIGPVASTTVRERLVPTAREAAEAVDGLETARIPMDRRPLGPIFAIQRSGAAAVPVGGRAETGGLVRDGSAQPRLSAWTGEHVRDLETIMRLREQNSRLESLVRQFQRENDMLKARLDTTQRDGLDLRGTR
jgi:hypothetical protein